MGDALGATMLAFLEAVIVVFTKTQTRFAARPGAVRVARRKQLDDCAQILAAIHVCVAAPIALAHLLERAAKSLDGCLCSIHVVHIYPCMVKHRAVPLL